MAHVIYSFWRSGPIRTAHANNYCYPRQPPLLDTFSHEFLKFTGLHSSLSDSPFSINRKIHLGTLATLLRYHRPIPVRVSLLQRFSKYTLTWNSVYGGADYRKESTITDKSVTQNMQTIMSMTTTGFEPTISTFLRLKSRGQMGGGDTYCDTAFSVYTHNRETIYLL
jgi:hypothetical protein